MLTDEKLARLNELAKKKKAGTLSEEEHAERKELHKEYIENFRAGFRKQIEGIKVVDEEGSDITPDKLKDIQKQKKIHNRHLED